VQEHLGLLLSDTGTWRTLRLPVSSKGFRGNLHLAFTLRGEVFRVEVNRYTCVQGACASSALSPRGCQRSASILELARPRATRFFARMLAIALSVP